MLWHLLRFLNLIGSEKALGKENFFLPAKRFSPAFFASLFWKKAFFASLLLKHRKATAFLASYPAGHSGLLAKR